MLKVVTSENERKSGSITPTRVELDVLGQEEIIKNSEKRLKYFLGEIMNCTNSRSNKVFLMHNTLWSHFLWYIHAHMPIFNFTLKLSDVVQKSNYSFPNIFENENCYIKIINTKLKGAEQTECLKIGLTN